MKSNETLASEIRDAQQLIQTNWKELGKRGFTCRVRPPTLSADDLKYPYQERRYNPLITYAFSFSKEKVVVVEDEINL